MCSICRSATVGHVSDRHELPDEQWEWEWDLDPVEQARRQRRRVRRAIVVVIVVLAMVAAAVIPALRRRRTVPATTTPPTVNVMFEASQEPARTGPLDYSE